jgi:hypothetical protein
VDSLKVSTRCGLSPKARQIRLIADCDMPSWRARLGGDQCVASLGVISSVITSTCSTCSSVIVRAAPGGAHRSGPPVGDDKPRAPHGHRRPRDARPAGDRLVAGPSAQASTIRQRNANAWRGPPGPALLGYSFVIGQRQLRQLRSPAAGWSVGCRARRRRAAGCRHDTAGGSW